MESQYGVTLGLLRTETGAVFEHFDLGVCILT